VLPSATKRLVERDQPNACVPPGDDVLGFKFKQLSLGIKDVEEIRQPSIIALGRKPHRVNGGTAGTGMADQTTLFGVVTRDSLVYFLHGT
jgi:hypothetical protein